VTKEAESPRATADNTRVIEGILAIYGFMVGTGLTDLWSGKGRPRDVTLYVIAMFWLLQFAFGARSHLNREYKVGNGSRRHLLFDLMTVFAFGLALKAMSLTVDPQSFFLYGAALFGMGTAWSFVASFRKGHFERWKHFLLVDLLAGAICLALYATLEDPLHTGLKWGSPWRFLAAAVFAALSVGDIYMQMGAADAPPAGVTSSPG
jgi:hypothetical protein